VRAASEVSLRAEPGKVTSLIGPNGAGKTTMLNMLSGFYRPDAGTIHIGNIEIQGMPAWRRARAGIARTYQTTQLFGSMTVAENLAIAGGSEALLSFVGYRGELDVRASDLPHVDKRLVEIARALATRPSVLLLDEPAAGLSKQDKQTLAALLRRIADSGIAGRAGRARHGCRDGHLGHGGGARCRLGDRGRRPGDVQRDPAVRNAYLGEHALEPSGARAAPTGVPISSSASSRPATVPSRC
jgi:ABC-type branched-subunit amino acid transport system ATPase component